MPSKFLKLPTLKLRGSIIVAAAMVLTVAIVGPLFYVVTSSRQADLVDAQRTLAAMSASHADAIELTLEQYVTAGKSTARMAEAVLADPTVPLAAIAGIVNAQVANVPDAFGMILLMGPKAGLGTRPDFQSSTLGYSDGYFGVNAARNAAGVVENTSIQAEPGVGYPWFEPDLVSGADEITGPRLTKGILYTAIHSIVRDPSGKAVGAVIVPFDATILGELIGDTAPAPAFPASSMRMVRG